MVAANVVLTPVVSGISNTLNLQDHVSLQYAASSIQAIIDAPMKLPSLLLEEIDSISSVNCSSNAVTITFGNATAWSEAYNIWPSSNFLLVTNHLGDCDSIDSRGIYLVNSLNFDNGSLTAVSSSAQVTLQDYASRASISFSSTPSASRKRDISTTISADFSYVLLNTTDLEIDVTKADITATLGFSGGIDYNFSTATLESLFIDFDLSSTAEVDITANARASYSHSLYSYSPAALTVSAFTIADIISIGPYLQFSVGIEFGASAAVDATAETTVTVPDGTVHLDFVNSNNTNATGWMPIYTAQANISGEAEVQLDPYVDVTAGFGIDFLNGLLDISAGIEAKPEIVNAFWISGDFGFSSTTGVSVVTPEGTCANGLWFASIFDFSVVAFIGSLWSDILYSVEVPIYNTSCIRLTQEK